MWAQQLIGPGTFREVDVAPPTEADLDTGEVLLEVLAGGICGSDLPAFKGMDTPYLEPSGPLAAAVPGFPMHEVVGTVLASRDPYHTVGSTVVGWDTRFTALAERTITRGSDLAPFDPTLSPQIAVMLQTLACVLYAVEQLPSVAGRRVTVLGQGPIGLLFSHVLKSSDAAMVVGVDRVDRSDVATAFGVDQTVTSYTDRWASRIQDADRPDLLIEAIGHQMATLGHAVEAAATGGVIYYFGVPDDPIYPLNLGAMFRRNLTLIAGITLERRRMLIRADDYLRHHPELATAYVTHVLPGRRAQEAFELASTPAPGRLKVALVMGTASSHGGGQR